MKLQNHQTVRKNIFSVFIILKFITKGGITLLERVKNKFMIFRKMISSKAGQQDHFLMDIVQKLNLNLNTA